jgi:RNase P subunit RPR2
MRTAAGFTAAVFAHAMKANLMFLSESKQEPFFCEICEQLVVKPLTMGIESNQRFSSLIQLCPDCGAVDLDLMQLCRELAISCSFN